jgi:pimeloyl-ACP methyl ester carboxylesterase
MIAHHLSGQLGVNVLPIDIHDRGLGEWDRYRESTGRQLLPIEGKLVLIGYSYGGLLALDFAARYPSKVDKLILLGSAMPKAISAPVQMEMAKYLYTILTGGIFKMSPTTFRRLFANDTPKPDAAAIFDELAPDSGRAVWEVLRGIEVDITEVKCPVLVISGTRDRISSPARGMSLARRLPNARFVETLSDHIGYGMRLVVINALRKFLADLHIGIY